MKNRNGTLGGGEFYSSHVKVIKGNSFVHSMRWRGPAAIVNNKPILSSERMLHKDYITAIVQLENKKKFWS
jgi:hypothetical protein